MYFEPSLCMVVSPLPPTHQNRTQVSCQSFLECLALVALNTTTLLLQVNLQITAHTSGSDPSAANLNSPLFIC